MQNDFTFTQTQSLYNDDEPYNIGQNDFVLAVNVSTTNQTIFPGDMSQYLSTVYMQLN